MNKQELIKLFNRKIEHYQEMLQGEHDDLADSIKIDIKALKTKTLETIDQLQNDRNIADEIKLAKYKRELERKYQVGRLDKNDEPNKKHFYFTQFVGSGTGNTDNGKVVEYELLTSASNCSPIINYKDRYFLLSWKDILNLAENAGLFEEIDNKVGV